MSGPSAHVLNGGRLHLQHGPIDLIVGCNGGDRIDAFISACERFETVLEEIVEELPALRLDTGEDAPRGAIPRRMWGATRPHRPTYVTPMAAVAGAVADEVLATMRSLASSDKIYVNNGGDIALHLSGDATATAVIATGNGGELGRITIRAGDPVRGIATSGRGGRSHSLGIADSVTVLARTAAEADAAATLIANAVDLPGHPMIERVPAYELDPDCELGCRLVTVGVGDLTDDEVDEALDRGRGAASKMLTDNLICGAALSLRGRTRLLSLESRITHPAGERLE